jgi:tRNA(Ser,Leu) C12 N-acetylase TAN1
VEDRQAFLEAVRGERERRLTAFQDLGRIIPVDRVFLFTPENFLARLQAAVLPYLDLLAGRRFYVRLERRGHKGEIVSPEAERAVDAFIEEQLEARQASGKIDFTEPDAVVAVETIGDRAGVGLLTREVMGRYDFVRVG